MDHANLSNNGNQLWGKFTDGVSDVFNKEERERLQQERLNYNKDDEIDTLNPLIIQQTGSVRPP